MKALLNSLILQAIEKLPPKIRSLLLFVCGTMAGFGVSTTDILP